MKVAPTFVALPLAAAVVAAISALLAGCGTGEESASSPTQEPTASAASATQPTSKGVDTKEVEAAARTFVEAWETFDYRDQEGRFNRVLPLLTADKRSQYTAFHENGYARLDELTGTTSVTASQATDVSENDVSVAVTTKRFRHFIAHLPGPKSELIEQSSVEQVECHLIFEDGQWLVEKWQIVSERLLPSQASPTPSGTTPSPYTWDPVVSMVTKDFVESYSSSIAEDVHAGENARYTDSSGTVWVRFGALSYWYSSNELVTAPFSGIMKETFDGDWELVTIGTSGVGCGVPADVQLGLRFRVCPTGQAATPWAKDEEEAEKAIKDHVPMGHGSGLEDIRVDDKYYYTDSAGVLWLEYRISPIPNGATDPAYGFMARVPGGNWEPTGGPGTWDVQCDLPADVQIGLGFEMCHPYEQEIDQAIEALVKTTAPPDVDHVIVDRKWQQTDASGNIWVACGALLAHGGVTDQVFCLLEKPPDGNWEDIAGPSPDSSVWCSAPPDAYGNEFCPQRPHSP